jgi:hypothetical protein
VEVEVDLVKREIHLDGVFYLQLKFSVRVSNPDVAGLDGEIELMGARKNRRTKRFIRSSRGALCARERSNVLAELEILEVDRGQRQKNASHGKQYENPRDQAPERQLH